MSGQRFFVSGALLAQRPVALTGDVAHQMRRVLRLAPGARVTLLDGEGWEHEAEVIAVTAREVRLNVLSRRDAGGEPRVKITLYQAVLKGERFEWALQKGTEAGVSAFAPLVTERTIIDDLHAVEGKRERWQRIIREAAEQCGRGRVPLLLPGQLLRGAVKAPALEDALRLIPWEGERSQTLSAALAACNFSAGGGIELFVGPEGGFSSAEIDWAQRHGVKPVTLGPRVLRAETAGLVATVAVLYHAGEF
jgi:16S rRNA (uracil1498-N3)-methyltransferase